MLSYDQLSARVSLARCELDCLATAVPVEKVVERIQLKEIPVVETEERVVEVVREIPVEIVKEVPVYIKVRHAAQAPRGVARAELVEAGTSPDSLRTKNRWTPPNGTHVTQSVRPDLSQALPLLDRTTPTRSLAWRASLLLAAIRLAAWACVWPGECLPAFGCAYADSF